MSQCPRPARFPLSSNSISRTASRAQLLTPHANRNYQQRSNPLQQRTFQLYHRSSKKKKKNSFSLSRHALPSLRITIRRLGTRSAKTVFFFATLQATPCLFSDTLQYSLPRNRLASSTTNDGIQKSLWGALFEARRENLLFLTLAYFLFGEEGRGAKVQGARCRASALPRGPASAVIGPRAAGQLDMQISTCRCGFMLSAGTQIWR